MTNRRPEFLPGFYYHIYNRGAHKQEIFKEHSNYLYTIQNIKKYSKDLKISIVAYCLMPNHYHLLVRQDGDFPAGLLPKRVFNSYTKAYNQSYSYSGTLFENSYRVKMIEDDSYLAYLCKYIHMNPMKAGLVTTPEDWEYSNYREFLKLRTGTLFDEGFFHEYFLNGKEYRDFVMEDSTSEKVPNNVRKYLNSLDI